VNEDAQVNMGLYCQELLNDARFVELLEVLELSLSQAMLASDTAEEREKEHKTFKGLKALLDLMQQFVIVKDQIAANRDESE